MRTESPDLRLAPGDSILARSAWLLLLLASAVAGFGAAKSERYIFYTNDIVPSVPWSIHVVKVERSHPELRFSTTLGGGDVLGMGNVTDQLKSLPAELGIPLAAINGDFYEKPAGYPGRPRDLQIRNGEVITQPAGHACFWIDPQGVPQMTNVFSRFRILWAKGKETPFSLNMQRTNNGAVLYTSVIGASTRTRGGIEYVLEQSPGSQWLPLRVGRTYQARVRQVLTAGDTPLKPDIAVLSVGPELASSVPGLSIGATVRLALDTIPNLSDVQVAIGGGPTLVENGKAMSWKGWLHMPHPRSALGWNKHHIFLVEVDGRQIDVSLGMTFEELANYMLKLGCENALNLDGGGSATLWAFGSVRNSPSEGQERPAPNALVVVRKHLRQTAQ